MAPVLYSKKYTSHGAYFDVAMVTLLVSDHLYAERQSLFFIFLKPHPIWKPLWGGLVQNRKMHFSYRVTNGNNWFKPGRQLKPRVFPQQHQKMYHVVYFLEYIIIAKFQIHCSIVCSDICHFVFGTIFEQFLRHQLSNLHNTESWISLEREKI